MSAIALIDYGAGNLRSVHNALVAAGAEGVAVTADPDIVAKADHFAPHHRHPLVIAEHRGFGRVGRDADDKPVHQFRAAPDNIDMAQGDGIKCPRIYADPLRHLTGPSPLYNKQLPAKDPPRGHRR